MMLTKHPCLFYEIDFRVSKSGRKLMIAEPVNGINGRKVVVATAHLESRKEGAKERFSQM